MNPKQPSPPPRRPLSARGGFTLIELLVVVGILIVLTTMTISLVNVTQDEDRVRAAAAQVQSFLEGARDRAIHSGEPRGVRFLLDPNNPNPGTATANSMLYIGAPEVYGAGQSAVIRPYNYDGAGNPLDWMVRPALDSELLLWRNFHDRGLISNGSPIQIEGQFYTIVRVKGANTDFFTLTKKYTGSKFQGLKYRLFLNPTVLPNQEPRQLPRNVVIDLDNSILPDAWSSGTLDVMFSPNGTVTGLVASAGVVHLYIADQADVDQVYDLDGDGIIDLTKGDFRFTPGANQIDPDGAGGNPPIIREGNERIVSLRTQTGAIGVHNVDPTDSNSDGFADDPFRYSAQGDPAR